MSLLETIEQELAGAFEGAEHLSVKADGNHLSVTIAWSGFDGLMPVKRQQSVYKVLNPYIASGEVHAVHMNLHTLEQWEKVKHFV